MWFLSTEGAILIGNLTASSNSGTLSGNAVTDAFDVSSLLPLTPATGWTLALVLGESNTASNQITLDWSKLTVVYDEAQEREDTETGNGAQAVPEPAALLLLGMSAATAGLRRYRRRR